VAELTIDQALQQAIEAHKAGQVQEADRLFSAILKAQPKHPDANHNMGVLAVGIGKVEQALPFLKTALEANPDSAQFWLSYIDALIKLGKLADAKAVLDQAKSKGAKGDGFDKLDQRLQEAGQEPVEVSQVTAETTPKQPNILDSLKLDQAISLAKKKAKGGAPEEAKRVYQDILTKFPQNKRARDGLKGLTGRTVSEASKVQNPPQDQLQALINLYSQGQLQQALKHAETLVTQFPQSAILFNVQGAVLNELGLLKLSVNAYTKALAIKPDYAEAYNNMGVTLKEQGKLEEAIQAYNKALAIKPDYVEAYNNMGNALKEQGKLEEAIEAYNKALAIKPDNADAYYNMGNVLKDQGKLEEAIEAYNKALTIKPDNAEAYSNMGVTLQEQGKLEEAIQAYNKALAIKPDYAEAKNNLAETLKIYSPKNNHHNLFIDLDSKIKAKHNKHALPKIDQELAAHTSNLLNELQSADKNLSTEYLQIYRRNSVDLNCKRHLQVFKENEIIPKFCFGCYKVQVDVTTVLDLIRLAALFYESEFESDLTRKCLVEVRPNIPGSYKGLIYCRGIDQAYSVKTQLDVHVRNIDKNLVAKIKKGCSEFPLAFPEYGEVAASEKEMMQYPQEWQALENEFDAKNLISPKSCVNSSLKEFCLSDYLIIQKWIDYAKGFGDPTSELFWDLPVKYNEIMELAKARVKQ
jgi:tetratricopeptide (TPR) repeat protein